MGSSRTALRAAVAGFLCFVCVPVRAQTASGRPPSKVTPKTIVDLKPDELRRQYHTELGHLEFVDNPEELRAVLSKTGQNVEAFFNNVQNTASKEEILAQRLRLSGIIEASSHSSYHYLLLAHPNDIGTRFEEERTNDNNRPINFQRLVDYLVTSGFAGQCVFLHPSHQYGSRFRYLGRQPSEPRAHVIAFAQKPEVGDFLNFINGTVSTPALLQGLLWIEPDTCQIVRMRTDLLEPDLRNRVTRQTTESWFSEVHFDDPSQSFWLPRRVLVTIEYEQRIFRNQHSYSDYKLFSVSSLDKITRP